MSSSPYSISFVGLALGVHRFQYELGEAFLQKMGYDHPGETAVKVELSLTKKSNRLDFEASFTGYTVVTCDITTWPYRQMVDQSASLIVKFGESYDYTDDEVWVIPASEHRLDMSQFFYEILVLSIPMKKIHPDVEAGKAGKETLQKLNELQPGEPLKDKKTNEIDPRWNKLRDLLD